MGHDYVGTEHVLLALVEDSATRAGRALGHLGLTPEGVRRDIERIIGTCIEQRRRPIDADALATLGIDFDEVTRHVDDAFGPSALERSRTADLPVEPHFECVAPRLERALQLARTQAGHGPVRSAHVLLSLAAVQDGIAARILSEHGVALAELRRAIEQGH